MTDIVETELTIEALGARGDGLARFEGERVYVPYAAAGDRLRARLGRDKEGALFGRIAAIEAPGPARIAPACRHFGDRLLIERTPPARGSGGDSGCGGCALQHVAPDSYRAWKLEQLRAALARHELPTDIVGPLAVSPPGSRRRADFTVSRHPDGVVLGFNARGSHRVVDLHECPVLRPALAALLRPLRDLLGALMRPGDAAEAKLTETDSGVDLLLVAAFEFGAATRQRLADFALRHDVARIARAHPRRGGAETLVERRAVRMVFGDVAVAMPPGAFIQATAAGEAALTAAVLAACTGLRRIADLYAGIGTFSLPLARRGATVLAIDSSKGAMAALADAGRAAQLPKLATDTRDLAKRALDPGALASFDAVVFDPPRAGAVEQAGAIAASKVPVVVAVSCNPVTFARDARRLLDGGYALHSVAPVDQFLWSTHLELVGVFGR